MFDQPVAAALLRHAAGQTKPDQELTEMIAAWCDSKRERLSRVTAQQRARMYVGLVERMDALPAAFVRRAGSAVLEDCIRGTGVSWLLLHSCVQRGQLLQTILANDSQKQDRRQRTQKRLHATPLRQHQLVTENHTQHPQPQAQPAYQTTSYTPARPSSSFSICSRAATLHRAPCGFSFCFRFCASKIFRSIT